MSRREREALARGIIDTLREKAERWEKRYGAQCERIAELAKVHSKWHIQKEFLVVRDGEQLDVSERGHPQLISPHGQRLQETFWCDECRTPWPCRTYLWATESEPFRVVLYPGLSPNGGFAKEVTE